MGILDRLLGRHTPPPATVSAPATRAQTVRISYNENPRLGTESTGYAFSWKPTDGGSRLQIGERVMVPDHGGDGEIEVTVVGMGRGHWKGPLERIIRRA